MKKIYLLSVLCVVCGAYALAQSSTLSKPKYFNIHPEIVPPLLEMVEGSLQFEDADGNHIINAYEQAAISLKIKNSGRGDAQGCVAQISATGDTKGVQYRNQNVPTIRTGETQTIVLPIEAAGDIATGSIQFTIVIDEPNGFGTDTMHLALSTKAFDAPMLKIVDYTINGENTTAVEKKMQFVLRLLLQNIQQGEAKDVTMQFSVPEEVMILDGEKQLSYSNIKAGEQKALEYTLAISNKYAADTLPVQIALHESYGKYAEDKTITLRINQPNSTATSVDMQRTIASGGPIAIGTLQRAGGANVLQSVEIMQQVEMVENSSVLTTYHNEFASLEMQDRDESFPYALFRIKLQGDGNKVRLAKQVLMLNLGQLFQTEKTVTSYNNQILFLIPTGTRNVYLTCGDGCSPEQLFSGRLEGNRIYEGVVEVK